MHCKETTFQKSNLPITEGRKVRKVKALKLMKLMWHMMNMIAPSFILAPVSKALGHLDFPRIWWCQDWSATVLPATPLNICNIITINPAMICRMLVMIFCLSKHGYHGCVTNSEVKWKYNQHHHLWTFDQPMLLTAGSLSIGSWRDSSRVSGCFQTKQHWMPG